MSDLIVEVALVLAGGGGRELVLTQALHLVVQYFQSETATLHELDGAAQLLHLVAQVGLPPQLIPVVATIPVGKGIAGQVAAENRPVAICNLQTDASGVAKAGARQTGVGGALCIPVRRDGQLVGTLGVGTVREYEYSAAEVERLEAVAGLVATCLR